MQPGKAPSLPPSGWRTPGETEVLGLIAAALKYREIRPEIFIGERTLGNQTSNAFTFRNLRVTAGVQAIIRAREDGRRGTKG